MICMHLSGNLKDENDSGIPQVTILLLLIVLTSDLSLTLDDVKIIR